MTTQENIRAWMAEQTTEDFDLDSCTLLAEACADAMGHPEWLDDPNHEVWEEALAWHNENYN